MKKLIEGLNNEGESIGIFDVSDSKCGEQHYASVISDAFNSNDFELELEIKWGIKRVYTEQININVD